MDATTPRQARLRLNDLERDFRRHLERYAPEDRLTLRALFEAAHTPQHADALAEALRVWRLPSTRPENRAAASSRRPARTAGAASDGPRQPAAPAQPSSR